QPHRRPQARRAGDHVPNLRQIALPCTRHRCDMYRTPGAGALLDAVNKGLGHHPGAGAKDRLALGVEYDLVSQHRTDGYVWVADIVAGLPTYHEVLVVNFLDLPNESAVGTHHFHAGLQLHPAERHENP